LACGRSEATEIHIQLLESQLQILHVIPYPWNFCNYLFINFFWQYLSKNQKVAVISISMLKIMATHQFLKKCSPVLHWQHDTLKQYTGLGNHHARPSSILMSWFFSHPPICKFWKWDAPDRNEAIIKF
jgi:hypothetical protein